MQMIMEMNLENNGYLTHNHVPIEREPPSKAEFQAFLTKYKQLTTEELQESLTIHHRDLVIQLNKTVPCVGCRRR